VAIQLQVNGQLQSCAASLNLTGFLAQLGLNPRLVAVEYNGEIIQRSEWEQTQMNEGDRLEIVTIVGGG
jgi:sulfur carrier protein